MKAPQGEVYLNGTMYLGLGELHSRIDWERTCCCPWSLRAFKREIFQMNWRQIKAVPVFQRWRKLVLLTTNGWVWPWVPGEILDQELKEWIMSIEHEKELAVNTLNRFAKKKSCLHHFCLIQTHRAGRARKNWSTSMTGIPCHLPRPLFISSWNWAASGDNWWCQMAIPQRGWFMTSVKVDHISPNVVLQIRRAKSFSKWISETDCGALSQTS